jgi:hypothetical protein
MLSKYWSVFLIAALALAALFHPKRREYFRSAAPWVTAGVFVVAVAPHVWWLIREDFPPITWVTWRRITLSFADTLRSAAEYAAGTVGYAIGAIVLVALFVRPAPRALADSLAPRDERRTAALLFWVPLLLPAVPALIKNISLISLWNTPALNLLPVMLLGSPRVALPRVALLRLAGVSVAISLLSVVASPIVAFVILKRGVENNAAYARLAMEAAEREWRATTDKPLKLIAGPFVLVSSAAFYGTDRPSTFADFSHYLSPWADDARVAREGMVIMVEADPYWLDRAAKYIDAAPGARRTEVTLTRRWLGFENTPKRFMIATVPPRP